MNNNNTSIHLDDQSAIRLAVYADRKGKKSLADAIQCLLDDADNQLPIGQQDSSSHNAHYSYQQTTIADNSNENDDKHPLYIRPKVVYLDADSKKIDEERFKRELLKTQHAEVTLFYHNGNIKKKPWNATKMLESSSVKANLNTGPLRNWKQIGIRKIVVRILPR